MPAPLTRQTGNWRHRWPRANLLKAKEMGMDMVVNCAACYNRSKVANYEIINSEQMRRSVADSLGEPYDGSVPVRHFVEILLKDIGPARLRKKIIKPLNGLKVAAYYGCYLVRPPEATNFDDPENPTILERLIDVTGAANVEWSGKVDCCGGMQNLTRTEITVRRSAGVIEYGTVCRRRVHCRCLPYVPGQS